MPVKPEQDILNEGPGLRQRARETKAVTNAVAPAATGTVSSAAAHYVPSVMDRINPKAKYGGKPGEKRLDVTDMTKPLSSYKKGTKYVPETGPAILHKGEEVIPTKENMATPYDMIHDKKPAKKIKEVRTRKAKSGGFIHEHHHTEPAHHPMEEHTTPDTKAMLAHMQEHMGESESAGEQASEPSAAEAQEKALGM